MPFQKIPRLFVKNQRLFLALAGVVFILSAIPLTGILIRQDPKQTSRAAPPEAATLEDYWQGKAKWELIRKLSVTETHPDIINAGTKIKVVDDTWYLFYRLTELPPGQCTASGKLSLRARKSTDKGVTWSAPVDVITPKAGSAYNCVVTDGDVYYNASENKWHALYQCLSDGGVWNGCYFQRSGADPLGPFTEPVTNPVIRGGATRDLWRDICNNSTKDCFNIAGGNRVYDAGTFEIFKYETPYYFVSFHGFDDVHGFRGIAKTTDFVNYIVGNPAQGVPADAVLDRNDAALWRENWHAPGNIGFGHASTLFQNGYYYTIAEAADMNLGCLNNQNWDLGIFRTSSLTSTTLEQFPLGNPILYSSKKPDVNGNTQPCNPAYGSFFQDPSDGAVYMHMSRLGDNDWDYFAMYLYKLVPSNNLLANAELWTCQVDPWKTIDGSSQLTNIAVYRFPNESTDANCFLATNVGGQTVQPGQSIYQDVSLSNLSDQAFTFGGKFAVTAGTGHAQLVLFQLDQNMEILTSETVLLNLDSIYRPASGTILVNPNVKTLRYQIYPTTAATIKMDEAYLEFTTAQPVLGDLNGDSKINIFDLSILLSRWGSSDTNADLNDSGKVDIFDLSILLSRWNP